MIHVVDKALEGFLRRVAPLPEDAVDVSFHAPDRTWGAGLTRPTTNVFLWEISRNSGVLRAGLEHRNHDGHIERRPATPIVDLNYLVTAWATEIEDEHRLLGSVLGGILANSQIPDDLLPDPLTGHRCGVSLAPPDTQVPGEFWSALDGRLKPGIQVTVSLPFDVFEWTPTATPAESVAVGLDALAPRRPPTPPAPTTRRRRINGALVMEGRPETAPESTDPSGPPATPADGD